MWFCELLFTLSIASATATKGYCVVDMTIFFAALKNVTSRSNPYATRALILKILFIQLLRCFVMNLTFENTI